MDIEPISSADSEDERLAKLRAFRAQTMDERAEWFCQAYRNALAADPWIRE